MSKLEFIKDQIIESRNFVNRLISELPDDLWFTIPDNTNSNFAWQIGHLMLSQNVRLFNGRDKESFWPSN